MAPHIANFLLGSFGIVAAVLLIGGSIALRWQKNRQRFELMRRALETGVALPDGPPLWLASRRQALSILAVGVGLALVGGAAWWLGSDAAMPAGNDTSVVASTEPASPIDVARDPRDLLAPRGPRPPAPNPQMERWHGAQERIAVGQTALGGGVILTLLGVVRLGYSRTERRVIDARDVP